MSVLPRAFFLPSDDGRSGQRFCLHHAPQGSDVRGAMVYVHPFAEEMNKSRRMAALQSRALAHAGYAVLQIDLLGCGDSHGDFGDATWADWLADIGQAARWMRQNHPQQDLWLWGLRAGCLLATAAANQIDSPCHMLFWQPVPAGRTLLQQFLRLKLAGDMLGGQPQGAMAELRERLAAGQAVDVAGYQLSPALADGLERATLAPPNPVRSSGSTLRAIWLELSTRSDARISPAVATAAEAWRQARYDVRAELTLGTAFWQTSEIEEVPALVDATLAALSETVGA